MQRLRGLNDVVHVRIEFVNFAGQLRRLSVHSVKFGC